MFSKYFYDISSAKGPIAGSPPPNKNASATPFFGHLTFALVCPLNFPSPNKKQKGKKITLSPSFAGDLKRYIYINISRPWSSPPKRAYRRHLKTNKNKPNENIWNLLFSLAICTISGLACISLCDTDGRDSQNRRAWCTQLLGIQVWADPMIGHPLTSLMERDFPIKVSIVRKIRSMDKGWPYVDRLAKFAWFTVWNCIEPAPLWLLQTLFDRHHLRVTYHWPSFIIYTVNFCHHFSCDPSLSNFSPLPPSQKEEDAEILRMAICQKDTGLDRCSVSSMDDIVFRTKPTLIRVQGSISVGIFPMEILAPIVENLTRSAGSKPASFELDGLILTASSISAHVLLGHLLGLRPIGHQSRSLPQPALSSETLVQSRPSFQFFLRIDRIV